MSDDTLCGKRICFPVPGRVELEDVKIDTANLGGSEVVVQGLRSVISPGTELAHFRGDSAGGVLGHAHRADTRFYPGYAMVGTVLAAGNASGLAPGMKVLSHTPHQSIVRFDARERVCVELPKGIGPDVAPFARLVQVGGISLQLSNARPGDTVAVIGLGPVGNLVAQLAQASGYRVVGVERSEARRALARAVGLTTVVEPENALEVLSPPGATLVLECSGRQGALRLGTELCALRGEIMTVGAPWIPEAEVAASSIVARVFERFLTLRSGWEWQAPRYGEGRSIANCTSWIVEELAAGVIKTKPLVSGVIRPEEAQNAYEHIEQDPDRHVTYLFNWEEN